MVPVEAGGGMTLFPDFDGETYEPVRDRERLRRQLDAVREVMLDGEWTTLPWLAMRVRAPEASVSARLRDLRKAKFGGYVFQRQWAGGGLWEYRLVPPPQPVLGL